MDRAQLINFIQAVTGATDDDNIAIARGTAATRTLYRVQDLEAVFTADWLDDNCYFSGAVFDGQGQKEVNVVRTSSIIVDLDCGTVGHKKKSEFETVDVALAQLVQLPIVPAVIWKTGHGVQAAFLLDQPILFADSRQADLYNQVKQQIFAAAHSDHTSARSNLFRVPGCMNIKPGCVPVRGELVAYEPTRRFSLAAFHTAFPAVMAKAAPKRSAPGTKITVDEIDSLSYESALALAVANGIAEEDAAAFLRELPGDDDRSERFFHAVIALAELELPPKTMARILSANPSFWTKYGGRFWAETERVCAKRADEIFEVIDHNPVRAIDLATTAPLSASDRQSVEMVCQALQIDSPDSILQVARLLVHIFQQSSNAIVSLPCGTGKSTAMLGLMVANASSQNPFMLVLETRDAVQKTFTLLNRLCPGKVGMYLGWAANECGHAQQKIAPLIPKRRSLCPKCCFSANCIYSNSPKALTQPIVVTTHASFKILAATHSTGMKKFTVVCDEDLAVFSAESFTAAELNQLAGFIVKQDNGTALLQAAFSPLVNRQGKWYLAAGRDAVVAELATIPEEAYHQLCRRVFAGTAFLSDQLVELLAKFLHFFGGLRNGKFATCVIGDRIKMRRQWVNLDQLAIRHFVLMDASAEYSLLRLEWPLFTCKQMKDLADGAVARLGIVVGNPTKSRRIKNISASQASLPALAGAQVLLVHNATGSEKDRAEIATLQQMLMKVARKVVPVSRGRLRGGNDYRDLDAIVTVGAGFFDGLEDLMLLAALQRGRTVKADEIWDAAGAPLMHKSSFQCREVQEIFIRQYIATLYQGLYRTALRNGQPIIAVIALPNVSWLVELRRLMRLELIDVVGDETQRKRMAGFLKLLADVPSGQGTDKEVVAATLGYKSFKGNETYITNLLKSFFKRIGNRFRRLP